ncbi:hypothetical protein GQ44DRAFT_778701 [Phaeosphaeriaceae sp. PMI808]|nr:hypothetical protein GQ44DRAFT_778701 [Phaeosphaeriaceae sp. PMI808]
MGLAYPLAEHMHNARTYVIGAGNAVDTIYTGFPIEEAVRDIRHRELLLRGERIGYQWLFEAQEYKFLSSKNPSLKPRIKMGNSAAEAKTATETLLQKLKPHMEDALGIMTLGDFLPVASQALDTIGQFEAEVPEIIERYISTCDELTELIQKTEDSPGQTEWKDVTINGESWFDHLDKLQTYIRVLQVQAAKKKIETPLPKYDEPSPQYEA